MELRDVGIEASPRAEGWTRLWGDVGYASGEAIVERYWLEVPADAATALSTSGDAWLAWLTPLAAALGEPLELRVPCDTALLRDMRELVRVWTAWYPALSQISIDAPQSTAGGAGDRVASFFSCGVDSFFTALRHANGDGTPESRQIDDHLLVWGFDIPLSNERAFQRVRASATQAAGEMGRRLVPIVTNLRETRFREADWSLLTHGAALAGVAHGLGAAYHAALIPSSAGYRDLRRWGSHPLTDPMMSSSRVRIEHDGPAFMRVEKTKYVAGHPVALRHLRVCYRDPEGGNCGRCNGCYRTMLALEALGVLERTDTFDRRWLDLRRAEHVYLTKDFDVRQFGYVLELARAEGRTDIARAVTRALRNSRRRERWVRLARRCRDAPVAWRWAPAWERWLLRAWIT
jgi:hypothetical protein